MTETAPAKSKGAGLRVQAVIQRALSQLLGYSHGGARDLYQVFGWPRDLTVEQMHGMYYRNPIAARVVKAFPSATWKDVPVIRDEQGNSPDPASKDYSPFVEAVQNFLDSRTVWSVLRRADRMCGIGRFSIVVLGFKDGEADLSKPLAKRRAKLLYMQPYGEPSASVATWDSDPKSERYGLPVIYQISQSNLMGLGGEVPNRSFRVHFSRVIHIAEDADESCVYGPPRLMSVFNSLMDLEKIVGGSAETYWINSNRGLALMSDATADLDEATIQDTKQQISDFQNQLQRFILGSGLKTEVLGSDYVDCQPLVDKTLSIIAGGVGMPVRILTGSEAGELASSQDESNWSMRNQERREDFVSPVILKPLIDIMISTGNLPEPKGKWWAEWPNHGTLSPQAAADVGLKKTQTLAAYVNAPGADLMVPPSQFVTEILGMTPAPDLDRQIEEQRELDEAAAQAALEGKVPGKDGQPAGDPKEGQDDTKDDGPEDRPSVNMSVRPAYVYRKVLNSKAILDWAKANGFAPEPLLKQSDLHVTLAHSTVGFDWKKAGVDPFRTEESDGTIVIPAGGPRTIERLGAGAVVLEFTDNRLYWRWQAIKDAGAQWDHMEYRPHITLAYGVNQLPMIAEAYSGPIVLGPECWADLSEVQ